MLNVNTDIVERVEGRAKGGEVERKAMER